MPARDFQPAVFRPVAVVPLWQTPVDLAHRLDVGARVVEEALPLDGVCFPGRAAKLRVLRPRLTEKLDQILAGLVLGLVHRHAQHVTERIQRTRQGVGESLDHRVAPALYRRAREGRRGEHGAVEHGVVRDDDHVRGGHQRFEFVDLARQRARWIGEVDRSHRAVVDRVGRDHDLSVLRVAVRARLDRRLAKRLTVVPQEFHAIRPDALLKPSW